MHPCPRGLIVEIGYPGGIAQQSRRHMERNLTGMRLAEGRKNLDAATFRERHRLTDESALADARRSRHADDTPVSADRSIQHAGDGVQFDIAAHQSRLRPTRRLVIRSDTQEAMRRHRLVAPLDTHQLRFAQHGGMFNQSRGGITEHHPTRRSNRLHPLRHPDLLTDRGVTQSPEPISPAIT